MPDNLNAKIGLDISEFLVKNEELKKQLRQSKKEMTDFANAGETSKALAAAKNVDALTVAIARNTRSVTEHRRAMVGAAQGAKEFGESQGKAVREVTHLSKEIANLDVNAFSVAKLFREFPAISIGTAAIAGAAIAMGKLADDAAKTVTSVRDLSDATGRSTNDILAMQKVFRDVNVDSAQVEPMLRKIAEDFAKAHQSAAGMESAISGVGVIRAGQGPGGTTQIARGGQPTPSGFQGGAFILRGGQPLQFDPTKGLAGLVDPTRFAATAAGQQKWQDEALKALQELNKTNHDLAMQVAKAQVPGADPAQALRALLALTPQAMAAARGATAEEARRQEEARRNADQLQIAQKNAEAAKEAATIAVAPETIPAATKATEAAATGVEALGETWRKTMDAMNADWQRLATDVAAGLPHDQVQTDDFEAGWTGAIKGIEAAWNAVVSFVKSNPLPSASGASGAALVPGMATGGMVPGSGGGDTVPAMLTPGEYVARRSSVGYYGTSLFAALNNRTIPRDMFSRIGYAAGGLVGASFAEGGVAGASGTPVHLHLDGKAFAMTAQDSVAQALVTTAQRYQMRSAGVKPSWYGGRPSA